MKKCLKQYGITSSDIVVRKQCVWHLSEKCSTTEEKTVADAAPYDTMETAAKEKTGVEVHTVGKIDRDIYKCITDDIVTDEVIITDERIAHIESRHPGDYQRYQKYVADMVLDPDYIIKDDRSFTAMVLKEFEDTDRSKHFRLALRLLTSADDQDFKNSVITFMKIRKKEYMRLVKNKQVLYKKE